MCTEDIQDIIKIIEVGQDMILVIEVVTCIIQEVIQGVAGIIIGNNRRGIYGNQNYDRNRSRSYERQNRDGRDSKSTSNSRSRSGSRSSTNRDRIRCFECREYNHFAWECLTRQASREVEQIQQMFNMDEDQTILQTPLMDTDEDKQTITPVETLGQLKLVNGKDDSATFLPFSQKLGGK